MKYESMVLWIVRISWPFLGGIWGAMTGFGGYHRLTDNADSFGTFFANGFFIATAIISAAAGITCGVLVGGLTEKMLRSLGMRGAWAVCMATIVNALVLWQLVGIVLTKYPGFRPPHISAKPKGPPTHKIPSGNPCAQPPPAENSKERANWDAECR